MKNRQFSVLFPHEKNYFFNIYYKLFILFYSVRLSSLVEKEKGLIAE